MKPRIFIGSSTEALEISNAIQQNLTYDAEVTVWNQGIFKLSSTTIDDLIDALCKTDYAIFVLNPDDITQIRNLNSKSIRDNVLFELGLFIGKLGKKHVFYLIPENETMHIPTDLLGINTGKYQNNRSDGNLQAAVGPFCNEVRIALKEYRYINLKDLDGERESTKKLLLERPFGYEFLILADLIESRLEQTNLMYSNLSKGVYFVRSTSYDITNYRTFFQETLQDFKRFLNILSNIVVSEIESALGPKGTPSKISDLKIVSDQIANLSFELFSWEARNEQIIPPKEFEEVKSELRGASNVFLSQLNNLPTEIRKVVRANQQPVKIPEDCKINISLTVPTQFQNALKIFERYYSTQHGIIN